MSKAVDLTKPLSDEDREYLKSRSRHHDIEANDLRFRKGKFAKDAEPEEYKGTNTVAAPPIEPGSDADNPPRYVGVRPHGVDSAVWGGMTGVTFDEATGEGNGGNGVEEVAPEDLTVEELKDELRERDLPLDGNKADLVKRLKKALKDEEG